jgi:hypothetical protein
MAMLRVRWQTAALVLLLGLGCAAPAARADQKLFLKDGRFQMVKSYEVHGDRVRYYSIQDDQWEEVPVALVDLDATKRAEQAQQAADAKQLEQAKELQKERFEQTTAAASGFEVAPGIHLPTVEGVYLYDGLRLIPMIQSEGRVVTDKERAALSIALPGPFLKRRSLVLLDGAQAAVRSFSTEPAIFVQSADGWGAHAELIPVKTAKESRVLEKVQAGIGIGKSGEIHGSVPIEAQQVAQGVYKITPKQPLEPGEYALAELIQDKLNLEVWDFGIDKPGAAVKLPTPTSSQPLSEQPPGQQPSSQPQRRRSPSQPSSDAPPIYPTSPPPSGQGPPPPQR